MKIRKLIVALAASTAAFAALSGTASAKETINGSGCSFCAPLWQQVGSQLKGKVTLNYASIGSGGGVSQFIAGTNDFAGTDPPLTNTQIGQALAKGGPTVHIPAAFAAITIAYKVPGVKAGLKFDGPLLANIYLGKVNKWNDGAIKKLNPKAKLPDLAIKVARRSDSSGTTAGFTLFLDKWSPEWHSKLGNGNTVKWPVGTGARGNEGVSAYVKANTGAIGYVEQSFAKQNGFTVGVVKNRKKQFVGPNPKSVSLAGANLKVQKSLRFTTIDNPAKGAYPITSQTFMINYRNMCAQKSVTAAKASAILGIVNYLYSKKGTKTLERLSYAAVPSDLKKKVYKQIATFNCNGKKVKAAKY